MVCGSHKTMSVFCTFDGNIRVLTLGPTRQRAQPMESKEKQGYSPPWNGADPGCPHPQTKEAVSDRVTLPGKPTFSMDLCNLWIWTFSCEPTPPRPWVQSTDMYGVSAEEPLAYLGTQGNPGVLYTPALGVLEKQEILGIPLGRGLNLGSQVASFCGPPSHGTSQVKMHQLGIPAEQWQQAGDSLTWTKFPVGRSTTISMI